MELALQTNIRKNLACYTPLLNCKYMICISQKIITNLRDLFVFGAHVFFVILGSRSARVAAMLASLRKLLIRPIFFSN